MGQRAWGREHGAWGRGHRAWGMAHGASDMEFGAWGKGQRAESIGLRVTRRKDSTGLQKSLSKIER